MVVACGSVLGVLLCLVLQLCHMEACRNADPGVAYCKCLPYRWDVSKLEPLVAAPHSPDNRKTARECSDVKIDRVYIGSCTGTLSGVL